MFIKIGVGALDKLRRLSKCVEYQNSKGKNVNQLWLKLSNMSTNTRLVREKKKRRVTSQISSVLVQCSWKCWFLFFFELYFSSHLREFSFHDIYSSLDDQISILIHVRKIFNCTMSFKMLLSVLFIS